MAKSKKGFFENPGSDNNLSNPNVQIQIKETNSSFIQITGQSLMVVKFNFR